MQAATAQRARFERSTKLQAATLDVPIMLSKDLLAIRETALGKHSQDEVGPTTSC